MNAVDRGTRRQHLTHRRASWLGVFAMLMMFIGPLISQSLPMAPSAAMAMAMAMDMSMDMSMPMPAAESRANGQHADHDHALHPLWEKCGYCSLFFHTPALPHTAMFFAAAQPGHSPVTADAPQPGYAGQAIFPGARTRAPPSLRHV
ncbi:DUF2946 domain-containing protein [Pseudomonas sp. dw_358]|uniref:DUF2946 domain-containing protein n=1 Tax=Pseudomonas sp. dw_358 TaxID=2720083 RepID=UPI001BD2512D|nr:DUF2946 domain-containing protein [Pseudomonas sp. dw_358]